MLVQNFTLNGRRFSGRANLNRRSWPPGELPLVVTLHGGTYTSCYFDVPGFSLLTRANGLNIPIVALDRPGYGATELFDAADATHVGNAAIVSDALADLWRRRKRDHAGVVLIGHSIGGAIALQIAARPASWPLLGVAVSGLGLKPCGGADAARGFPPTSFVEIPDAVKDGQMFGAPGSFLPLAPDASRVADAPAPRQELVDILSDWPHKVRTLLPAIGVPIHYRQADHDNLWIVSPEEVAAFAASCSNSPHVDSGIVENAGHCIDFHKAGAGFQLEQLAFALRCAVKGSLLQRVGR